MTRRRDIFKERLSREELADLLTRAGLTPHEVLSQRSRPYKDLGLRDREVSEDELIDLMVEYPALIRRPLVLSDSGTVVGFNRAALADLVQRA